MTYKLQDASRQAKLDEFANAVDPSNLKGELAAARFLTSEALESSPALSAGLLTVVAKLSGTYVANQVRIGELLQRRAVLKIGMKIVELLAAEIERHGLSEEIRNSIVDGALAKFEAVINEEVAVKKPQFLLEDQREPTEPTE